MMAARRESRNSAERPMIRIGLLRLTDAAPVIIAAEKRLFAHRGLEVRLSVEPSWSNIADKLAYRHLDAAVMLPPLALAVSLGLRGIGIPLIVPMSLSLNGNSVTVSKEIFDAIGSSAQGGAIEVGRRLRDYLSTRPRPRFAVVHVYSTHNLLLRYWLAACGIDPDRDIELSVVPPAETTAALRTGQIDGFCAGAPWGEMAARAEVGATIVTSSEIWHHHPEKCLAVSRDWAAANPAILDGMMDALIEAARFCDDPAHAKEVAWTLGSERYLALDPAIIRKSLPAADDDGQEGSREVDRSVFFAGAANFPWRSHAAWFLEEMARWGYLPPQTDRAAAAAIYRPDLFRSAAGRAGIMAPAGDAKAEGAHAAPWQIDGVAMGPDLFCDRKIFPA